ncbi:MAG TPA: invasion associated locus B family protein [Devosiaceae bacterium]|nr:invasion associated locus B family protein [Devosiaceae bacterium]
MSNRGRVLAAGALASALLASGAAQAQAVKQIGSYHDWSAYSANQGNGQICFAVAKPTDVAPSPEGYSQAYLYITDRPSEQITNEINLIAGFTMASDQPATLSVADQSFPLFVQADSAWLQDPTKNETLAGAMRAGTTIVVDATTDKGIKVRETFSLAGATAASKAIGGSC